MLNRLLSLVVVAGFICASGCAPKAVETPTVDPVARGAYLSIAGGCGDCHTPLKMSPQGPAPDASMLLSGHPASLVMPTPPPTGDSPWAWYGAITSTAFAGPWGISYAINLTPDLETGLGKWSETQFVQAMRTGRHLGNGRPILPPMPWPNFARMTDADLSALFMYLRSIAPIVNKVPEAVPALPPAPPGA
ncbi:MAG: diheme cytochrome c-553 [Steroidobacteraceae bacterium]